MTAEAVYRAVRKLPEMPKRTWVTGGGVHHPVIMRMLGERLGEIQNVSKFGLNPDTLEAGARKVYMASAAPPVRFPNVYGIDMPTRAELIAAHRTEEEVAREIGADALIYQDLDALKEAVRRANPKLTSFETSCFDGHYITGDITTDYLKAIEIRRDASRDSSDDEGAQLDLNLATAP